MHIQRVEELILDNRRITCQQIAKEINVSVETVNKIIHEHLKFSKVSARWVPRQLSAFARQRRLQICKELKQRFDKEGQLFLYQMATF